MYSLDKKICLNPKGDDLGILFKAIESLKRIAWFKKSVRDIRGYKVENWSDFTAIVKDA